MITSEQIRAARAFLKWSADDLAKRSGIGISTIKRLELQPGVPSVQAKTLQAIQEALEVAGIEFLGSPDDRPGVLIDKVKPKKSAAKR